MMAEAAATDWIEWNGGECPVGDDQRVDVRFRDGDRDPFQVAGFWRKVRDFWRHEGGEFSGPASDIIAYRVLSA